MSSISLYPFQQAGVDMMHATKARYGGALRVLLADQVGLGKTPMSLTAVAETPDASPCLIVCPASLKIQWQEEIRKFLGDSPGSLILEGNRPWASPQTLRSNRFTIINYEIVGRWLDVLVRANFHAAILDEVHRIKNQFGKTSRVVRQACHGIKHLIAVSGTAVVNNPIEIWPVANTLWPLEFDSIFDFGDLYCCGDREHGRMQWKGARNLKNLSERLTKAGMVRRLRKDVLAQLPEKRQYVINVPVSDPVQYLRAQQDFIGWLREWTGKPLAARNAERALQFAQFHYLRRLTSELKMPAVLDWIDDRLQGTEDKILVACVHRQSKPFTLQTIYERFRDSAVQIHGGVSPGDREKAKKAFKTSKECRLLVGQIRACGEGLNLQEGHVALHVELDWNRAAHEQFSARIHRIGLKHPVDEVFLVAKGTIEEKVAKIIQTKEGITSTILDGKKDKAELLNIFDKLTEMYLEDSTDAEE